MLQAVSNVTEIPLNTRSHTRAHMGQQTKCKTTVCNLCSCFIKDSGWQLIP